MVKLVYFHNVYDCSFQRRKVIEEKMFHETLLIPLNYFTNIVVIR